MTTTRRASVAAAAAAALSEPNVDGIRACVTRSTRKSQRTAGNGTKLGNAHTSGDATEDIGAAAAKARPQTRKRPRGKEQPDAPVSVAKPGNNNEGINEANTSRDAACKPRSRSRKSAGVAVPASQTAATEARFAQEQQDVQEPLAKRPRKVGHKSKADETAAGAAFIADTDMGTASAAPPSQENSAAATPAVVAAQASHELQPQEDPAPLAPTVAPPQQPLSPRPHPRSPLGQRAIQIGSPQRRPLGINNISGCILPAAATSDAAAPGPLVAPSSPKIRLADQAKSDATLEFEGDLVHVRRLLRPGALAGTLVSCAAASASVDTGKGGGGPEPAARSAQFKELYGMVSDCSATGRGTAIYISGLPGTGKTYTVSKVLAALSGPAATASGVSFCCATLNCMAIDDPAKLYGRLQNELSRTAMAEQGKPRSDVADTPTPADASAAHDSLRRTLLSLSMVLPGTAAGGKCKGTKRGRGGAAAQTEAEAPGRRVFVVVLDEVDRLLRRRDGGEELARLLQLPATPGLSLVLLTVANSLDLTERMMPLLRARGLAPRHMVFTAYSRPQVLAILQAQLNAHPRGQRFFEPAALDMVAKSVSSSSGDLRQALKACRTALDVLLDNIRANPAVTRTSVGIREMHTALQRISSQGNGQSAMVAKIKGLPPQQQLVLLALATAVGARAAASGADAAGPGNGGALFTGSRPKFVDTVAFREIGNQASGASANNPGACFDGAASTPGKAGRLGGAAPPASTPTASRVRGVLGPGGGRAASTPGSCSRGDGGPPSRTPGSILAGDAGLALGLADVYGQYTVLCRQLDIPAMSESAFRTDALPGLDCDGLLRVTEGRTMAATRLSLRAMVRDVQAALADNVMFKRLMGAKAPAGPGTGPVVGVGVNAAAVPRV